MRTANLRMAVGLAAIVTVAAACSDREMTVGSGPEPSKASTVVTEPTKAPPVVMTTPEVWSGTIEGIQLRSGSNRIEVTLTSATTATLVFGESRPTPPVDPNVLYLTDCMRGDVWCAEGLTIEVHDVKREDRRLQFTFDPLAPWAAWCEAQTSIHPVDMGGGQVAYVCGPPAGIDRNGSCFGGGADAGVTPAADCVLAESCQLYCACTSNHCAKADQPGIGRRFDFHITGDEAEGTSLPYRIHLTRKEAR